MVLTQEVLLLPADLAVTTPDPKEEMLDTVLEAPAHRAVAHQAVQAHQAEATAHLKEPQPVTDQSSTPNQLQLAALATKDHQVRLDLRDLPEIPEKMVTTERTERTVKMPNCWLPSPPKSALFAQQDHKDPRDHQEPRDRQDLKAVLENLREMVFQESKAWPELQVSKAAQEEKDHVEPQANQDVLSPFQAHKAQLAHQDNQENPVQRVNQVPMDNRSKDHQDCQETLASQAARVVQDLKDLQDPAARKERRDLANTAHLHALHLAIKPSPPEPFVFPLDCQWPFVLLLFVCLYCPTKMFAFPASQSLNSILR